MVRLGMGLAALRLARGVVLTAAVTTAIVAAAMVVVGIVLAAGGLEFVTGAGVWLIAVGFELVDVGLRLRIRTLYRVPCEQAKEY